MAVGNLSYSNELPMPTLNVARQMVGDAKRVLTEEGVIDFVAKLSPWLAPLPSAFFVYQATMDHLTDWSPLAITIAVVIETLGLTTTHTALGMHAWNQTHHDQPEKQAPFGLAVVLALVYVAATLMLIGVLEVMPNLDHYAPAMFPLLAVVGAINLALRSHHNVRVRNENEMVTDNLMRQRQIEDEDRALKAEEKRAKVAAKYGVPVARTVPSTVPLLSDIENVTPNVTLSGTDMTQRRATLSEYLSHNENPGASALGRMFNVDRKTIYRDLEVIGKKETV